MNIRTTLVALALAQFASMPSIAQDLFARVTADVASPEEPFSVQIRFEAREDGLDTLLSALEDLVESTRKEAGNLACEVHQSASQPNSYLLMETWAHLAAFHSHSKQPYAAALLQALKKGATAPPAIELMLPAFPQPGAWGTSVVREALARHKVLPPSGLNALFYFASGYDPAIIEVRFNNSKIEGADPNVSPMFRIFRVLRKDQTIEVYDPVDDTWISWGAFLKYNAQP
ncbi:MAG: putative quinol monooxygenase [Verrucomicrobiales bacterium]